MSENIQSISQGTYTIGNTNELTFSAGPGIKIDEPSAGTVRIGTDETVLWSGSGSSDFSLSESIHNFEQIKVTMIMDNGTQIFQNSIHEFQPNSNMNYLSFCDTIRYPVAANYPVYDFRWGAAISNGTSISNITKEMLWHTKTTLEGGLNENPTYYPVKVIGINRISNA